MALHVSVNLREGPACSDPRRRGRCSWPSMLSSVPVADVSDVALVNMVSAWQQVVNMAQAAQAEVIREIEARTSDALARRSPTSSPVRSTCTRRAATDLFVRAWGAGQHVRSTPGHRGHRRPARSDVSWPRRSTRAGRRATASPTRWPAPGSLTAPQLTRHVRAAVIATVRASPSARRVSRTDRRSVELALAR